MTLVEFQNDRYPKWPLSKMTVNLAPKWPLYQNDRYFIPKWPLFCTKMTVISRFLSNGHFGHTEMTVISKISWPNWPLFKPKMTVKLPKWPLLTKMTVIYAQNDRCGFPKWPLYLQKKLTVILVKKIIQNDRYGTKMTDMVRKRVQEPGLGTGSRNRV